LIGKKGMHKFFVDGEKCVLNNIELPKMFSAVSLTSDFCVFSALILFEQEPMMPVV